MRSRLALAALALLVLSACASVNELSVGVGKSFRVSEGFTGGIVSVAARTEDWEFRVLYVGAQTIYPQYGGVDLKAYVGFIASRYWDFRDGRNFEPELGIGAMFKENATCKFDGDLDCDRRTPLWFNACPHFGSSWHASSLRVMVWHCSNDQLDAGHAESKNLGEEFLLPEIIAWERGR